MIEAMIEWIIPVFYLLVVSNICSFVAGMVYGIKCQHKKEKSNETL